MERDTRHVSEDEKKKGLVILILVGILVAIALIIIIIMIPKGKKEEIKPVELSSTVSAPDSNLISRDNGTG